MRRLLSVLTLVVLLPAAPAQVVANSTFATAIGRARALEAGARANDVPHHIHYELKLYSHTGKLTTGTWDIWRDPFHWSRSEIVAGDFHYTQIEDLVHRTQWRQFNTVMPLKVYDLRQNFLEPAFAVSFLSDSDPRNNVHFEQIEGSPYACTNLRMQMRVCFDPLVHVLAAAQMINQTVTWEDWQPVGAHSIPRRFRIYDAGRVMVEAVGQAEFVKVFPPDVFKIPANEPDMGEPEGHGASHQVVSSEPVRLGTLYGNLLMKVDVDADGHVRKTQLIDADDNDLVRPAEAFAKHLIFASQSAPFEQYIYLRYAPGAE
jgi:hypothetical protein